ncbi:hypothetical protein ACFWBM_27315 [Streptomyces sp. NPDC059980]|uniref:hypothetical protein n=1 Tax=Streptomyces sp. NPDC059980 TaxID=3347022 RepID=UPI003686F855
MLRTAEIRTELTAREDTHLLYWRSSLEFSLDSFICERTGRTTLFDVGAEQALCSGSRSGFKRHHAPARIAGFDTTSGRERLALRALVDFWWAPFTDSRDSGKAAAPTRHPWVRLHLAYYCPVAKEAGTGSIQTNLVRPARITCEHCDLLLAVDREAPAVRLLG